MRRIIPLLICVGLAGAKTASAGVPILHVSDPGGTAARAAAPVSVEVDLAGLWGQAVRATGEWELAEIDQSGEAVPGVPAVPVQFEPDAPRSKRGTLWWIMPNGSQGQRRFRLLPAPVKSLRAWQIHHDKARQTIDLVELPAVGAGSRDPRVAPAQGRPVLRYNYGSVPVPEETPPHFAPGESYERGDYIHPLYGPDGEVPTDDYPKDHPHHRGVWWSWPVTRWKDEVADIWAVVGVWSRPVAVRRIETGPVMAVIEAENVWKFGKDQTPIAREEVLIRAFRRTDGCRFVDVEVRLTALEDDVAIGGRPKAGYGGFALRAAPCESRVITPHMDSEGAEPRRAWIDYSGVFPGGEGMAGVAIFEHVTNPDYPNPLHEYPDCNCVMPAYPAAREVALAKDKPLVLKHRLWIHAGGPDEEKLADAWAAYANPPKVTIVTE